MKLYTNTINLIVGKFLIFLGIVTVCYLTFNRGSGSDVAFPKIIISTPTEVKNTPTEDRIRVLLFTGTEWCPACMQLESSVISTPAWKEFAAGEIRFLAVNIPADQSKAKSKDLAMLRTYGVQAFPTMLVLDAKGDELSRQVGSGAPVENYKEWIRRHASLYKS